jgi:hypothetical protein
MFYFILGWQWWALGRAIKRRRFSLDPSWGRQLWNWYSVFNRHINKILLSSFIFYLKAVRVQIILAFTRVWPFSGTGLTPTCLTNHRFRQSLQPSRIIIPFRGPAVNRRDSGQLYMVSFADAFFTSSWSTYKKSMRVHSLLALNWMLFIVTLFSFFCFLTINKNTLIIFFFIFFDNLVLLTF